MNKRLEAKKQYFTLALNALAANCVSFVTFLEANVEVSTAVTDLAPSEKAERAINEAQLCMR